jgi:glutamine amidotransferase
VPRAPEELADAAGVIVPGVGHFGATRALDGPWIEAILGRVGEGRPLLGICLGMQWLFEGSDEAPEMPGLGLLDGRCYRLRTVRLKPDTTYDIKVPHVGWNGLSIARDEASILAGVPSGSQVYFTHSYVAPLTGDSAAVTEHGEPFAAVVQRGYIAGVQFHPEKSGDVGLRILRNFVELAG